jgi:hypothetical protein
MFDYHLLNEPARGRYRFHDLIRRHARSLAADTNADQSEAAVVRLLDPTCTPCAPPIVISTRECRWASRRRSPPAAASSAEAGHLGGGRRLDGGRTGPTFTQLPRTPPSTSGPSTPSRTPPRCWDSCAYAATGTTRSRSTESRCRRPAASGPPNRGQRAQRPRRTALLDGGSSGRHRPFHTGA